MFCSKCGDPIEQNEKFCNKCGNPLNVPQSNLTNQNIATPNQNSLNNSNNNYVTQNVNNNYQNPQPINNYNNYQQSYMNTPNNKDNKKMIFIGAGIGVGLFLILFLITHFIGNSSEKYYFDGSKFNF